MSKILVNWTRIRAKMPSDENAPPMIETEPSPGDLFTTISRSDWASFGEGAANPFTTEDVKQLRSLNDRLSAADVTDVYLPLAHLLRLNFNAARALTAARSTLASQRDPVIPYVIGIAGSVAVGKSTTARVLRGLISKWQERPRVELVATDGFLLPNRVLEERGLMNRKGFPQTYDLRGLLSFLIGLRSGAPVLQAPVYSHLRYDIVPAERQLIERPDILILEGLNILQLSRPRREPQLIVSDFLDFSVYVDADTAHIREWYAERFELLQRTAFQQNISYFHALAHATETETRTAAYQKWDEINEPNLRDNIAPTRSRATLILKKDREHSVTELRLRRC
jgi:type I pantothenate kinase